MGAMQNEAALTAVVSGASGYIGTELVKQLLEKGYNVRGTVRSTTNTEKTEHLTKLAEVRDSWQEPRLGLNNKQAISMSTLHRPCQGHFLCTKLIC